MAGTPGAPREPLPCDQQALAEEIERTREELGAAVQALAAKADVKARAREKAAEMSGRLTGAASQARAQLSTGTWQQRRVPLAMVASAILLAGLIMAWRRR